MREEELGVKMEWWMVPGRWWRPMLSGGRCCVGLGGVKETKEWDIVRWARVRIRCIEPGLWPGL